MSCSRHTTNQFLGYTKYYQYRLCIDSLWLNCETRYYRLYHSYFKHNKAPVLE